MKNNRIQTLSVSQVSTAADEKARKRTRKCEKAWDHKFTTKRQSHIDIKRIVHVQTYNRSKHRMQNVHITSPCVKQFRRCSDNQPFIHSEQSRNQAITPFARVADKDSINMWFVLQHTEWQSSITRPGCLV